VQSQRLNPVFAVPRNPRRTRREVPSIVPLRAPKMGAPDAAACHFPLTLEKARSTFDCY
jgi:hypothetical protein